jgi:hypothetical protein
MIAPDLPKNTPMSATASFGSPTEAGSGGTLWSAVGTGGSTSADAGQGVVEVPFFMLWQMRGMLVAMAVGCGLMAYGWDASSGVEVMWPSLWQPAIATVSVLCLLFALLPHSEFLYVTSGVLTPVICVFRLFAVAANRDEGVYADPRRAYIGWGIYLIVGVLWATCWVYVLGRVHGTHKYEHRRR